MAKKVNKWFKPRHKVGYSASYSPNKNFQIGMKDNIPSERDAVTIGRQLQALANVQEHKNPSVARSFRESADYAFKQSKK
jgi:hypothetical protein